VPGRGIGTPERLLRWQLGRLYWFVLDYGTVALVSTDKPGSGLFLELYNFNNRDCRTAQQAVMERVVLRDELRGALAYDPLPTATVRPPLEGFSCPNTPPTRLRVGDSVHIVTDTLWLRSAPRATDDTKMDTYLPTAPYYMEIIDGPVCTEKFVYWQVRMGLLGEGPTELITGWFAEGDLKEYYLAPGS
jgi:hypothetical protein